MILKAAIIGAGIAGQEHARQLASLEHVQIVAVADIDPAAASAFCGRFGGRPYGDVHDLVRTERPDLLVIASSNHAHAENVIAAIDAGARNIFCEKPLAINLPDAVRMVEMAEKHQVRTSMGFAGLQPAYLRLKELLGTGQLGRILSLELHTYRGYGFWDTERTNYRGFKAHHQAVKYPQISGGWTIHHACHQIFILSRMAGAVKSVFGRLSASSNTCPSEELIHATLVFASGALGTLIDSIGSFRGLRCGAIGTRGTVLMQDDFLKKHGSNLEIRIHMEGEDHDRREVLPSDTNGPTRLTELIDAIRRDLPSPITFREGLENLVICQAIRQSSERGAVVDIALPWSRSADPAAASPTRLEYKVGDLGRVANSQMGTASGSAPLISR